MAVLTGVLALAVLLAFAPPGASGRRIRRAMTGAAPASARAAAALRPGSGWHSLLLPGSRKSRAAPDVSMTVVVQQLAALLKGGRSPARLWEELWLLYGSPRAPGNGEAGRLNHGDGRAEALSAVSREVLASARAASRRGSPVAAAIRSSATRQPGGAGRRDAGRRELTVWVEVAACFDVAEASGCPLAEVLTRFAAHLEAEDDAEAARQTALAGPRATVRILTWLPFLGLGLGMLLGVDPVAILLGNPLGVAALGAGLVLTAAGRIWSARLVRAAAGRQR